MNNSPPRDEERLLELAFHLMESHVSFDKIEHHLSTQTKDTVLVMSIMERLREARRQRSRSTGERRIALGLVALLSGFLIVCARFNSGEPFLAIMLVTTTVGLILVLWGAYEVMG